MTWHEIISRFLYRDFYVPVWPNIVASVIAAIAVFVRLHIQELRQRARHRELIQVHSAMLVSHRALHDKIDALILLKGTADGD